MLFINLAKLTVHYNKYKYVWDRQVYGIQVDSTLYSLQQIVATYKFQVYIMFGVSLSEPHNSRTALRKCVNVRACLEPYTVNFKCMFKYFPKIEHPRALGGNAGLLPSAALATVPETA